MTTQLVICLNITLLVEETLAQEDKASETIMGEKESIHPALAETNTKHRELQWRKIGYFLINGATQGYRKLMFKSLNHLIQGSEWVFEGDREDQICTSVCWASFD